MIDSSLPITWSWVYSSSLFLSRIWHSKSAIFTLSWSLTAYISVIWIACYSERPVKSPSNCSISSYLSLSYYCTISSSSALYYDELPYFEATSNLVFSSCRVLIYLCRSLNLVLFFSISSSYLLIHFLFLVTNSTLSSSSSWTYRFHLLSRSFSRSSIVDFSYSISSSFSSICIWCYRLAESM